MQRLTRLVGVLTLMFVVHSGSIFAQQEQRTTKEATTRKRQRRFTFQQFSRRHDANKDGEISREEFQGDQKFFKRLDNNGDGIVTEAEFATRAERGQQQQKRIGRAAPDGVNSFRDLEYAVVDGQSLRLDLFVPEETASKPPLLVWIHGGGWTKGSKSQFNPIFLRLTEEGYATASVDYRLEGLNSHPKQIHDFKGAVRWLRAQSEKYGYDTTRIAVGGGSAGGHLALLLGLSDGVKELEGNVGGNLDQSSRAHAIIDLYGPSQLQLFAEESKRFGRNKTPELLRSASPLTYLDKHDPPVIIFYGDQDKVVPPKQNEVVHQQYQAAGLQSSLHMIKGAGHGGPQFSDEKRYELVKEFVDRHIKHGRQNE
jgi:acetyl esterase/lipase